MKTSKKLLVVVLALVMILACAVPAMAEDDPPAIPHQAPYVEQVVSTSAPTVTGTFTVYLSIESYDLYVDSNTTRCIERQYLPVSMGASGVTATYYVSDVLAQAKSTYTWLKLYNYSGQIISGTPPYLYEIKDTGLSNKKYGHLGPTTDYNGWMFRVNGKFPLINSSEIPAGESFPYGASITQAYVVADDRIDIVLCNANEEGYSTHWTLIDNISYSSGTLEFYLSVSDSYYQTSDDAWIICNYEEVDSLSCSVYVDGTLHNVTTGTDGKVTITGLSLSSGTHTIYFPVGFGNWRVYSGSYIRFPYMTGYTTKFTF